MQLNWIRKTLCLAMVIGLTQAIATADSGLTVRGVTLPSKVVERAFMMPGTVKEAMIKDGDTVQAGQVLFVLDDQLEAAGLRILKLQADSTVRVEAAKAELATATVRLDRLERLGAGAVSPTELEEARLAVEIAKLQVQAAEEDRLEKSLQVERQNVIIERMRLTSPIDGVVERITAVEGQLVDPAKASCVVLQIDPLWVEIRQLRSNQIAHLRPGQTVQVRYTAEEDWTDASVMFISSIGDPASGTQLVRLELPNPAGRASGQEVQVRVPPAGQAPHARAGND
jgi:RND family efflux transporter MFP subunit